MWNLIALAAAVGVLAYLMLPALDTDPDDDDA
jgi:hypothetical protein